MNQKYKPLNLLIYLAISLLMFSCNPSKKVSRVNTTNIKLSYIIDQFESQQVDFNTINAKFVINAKSEDYKQKIKGTLRIKHDSAIWVSVAPVMGIEMARVMITPDSIKMFDRINKTYFVTDFSFINNRLHADFDYDMLQSILLGKDFSKFDNKKWNASVENNMFMLYMTDRKKKDRYKKLGQINLLPLHKIWLDKSFKIRKMLVESGYKSEDVRKVSAHYKKYKPISSNQELPMDIQLSIKSNLEDVSVHLKYSKMTINDVSSFPFNIPKGYSKQ